jgi:hypothetical protein
MIVSVPGDGHIYIQPITRLPEGTTFRPHKGPVVVLGVKRRGGTVQRGKRAVYHKPPDSDKWTLMGNAGSIVNTRSVVAFTPYARFVPGVYKDVYVSEERGHVIIPSKECRVKEPIPNIMEGYPVVKPPEQKKKPAASRAELAPLPEDGGHKNLFILPRRTPVPWPKEVVVEQQPPEGEKAAPTRLYGWVKFTIHEYWRWAALDPKYIQTDYHYGGAAPKNKNKELANRFAGEWYEQHWTSEGPGEPILQYIEGPVTDLRRGAYLKTKPHDMELTDATEMHEKLRAYLEACGFGHLHVAYMQRRHVIYEVGSHSTQTGVVRRTDHGISVLFDGAAWMATLMMRNEEQKRWEVASPGAVYFDDDFLFVGMTQCLRDSAEIYSGSFQMYAPHGNGKNTLADFLRGILADFHARQKTSTHYLGAGSYVFVPLMRSASEIADTAKRLKAGRNIRDSQCAQCHKDLTKLTEGEKKLIVEWMGMFFCHDTHKHEWMGAVGNAGTQRSAGSPIQSLVSSQVGGR